MFTQPFIQMQIKENIKAPRHWPLCGEFTGDRWIPRTNGQLRGKCFHLMTSSCRPFKFNTKYDDVIMSSFQIPHKIFYPHIERCRFFPQVKLSELFDIRAHQYFWIAHGVTSCARTGNALICVAIFSFICFRTTVIYIYLCLVRQWWHNDMVIQAVATISISIFVEQSFLAHEWKYNDILNNWKRYL